MHVQFHARSLRALAVTAIAVASLAACSTKEKESTGDVTASAAAPATSTVAVADIDVGRSIANMRVTDKTDNFKATDTVYASVHTTGSASAANVMARWTFEDGQTVQESTQSIAPTGDAYTEFHISKPGGWPKGKYRVTLSLAGSTESKDFEVK
jgi:uncharacterized cupredoxin-like copper-binding protein